MWKEILALDGYDEFVKNNDMKEVVKKYRKWILRNGGSDVLLIIAIYFCFFKSLPHL